jgi:beta-galactosidase
LLASCENSRSNKSRQKINFDFDWKFSKGDFPEAKSIVFDDSNWENLDVPHDWSIHDIFSKDNPTGKAGGFASGGIVETRGELSNFLEGDLKRISWLREF